jgi:cytochrome c peroxidase
LGGPAPANRRGAALLAAGVALLVLSTPAAPLPGAAPDPPGPPGATAHQTARLAEPITPIPSPASRDPAKLWLGERLFRDPRLSRDGTRACASCHDLERNGADDRARSIGAQGRPLDYNTPTVFNAALSFRLNWRGNFRSFEELAEAVLRDPRLMDMDWAELVARLRADPGYRDAFARIYGGDPAPAQVLDALAAFQRSLLTPGAPFDRFLRGERGALAPEQERGYELFKTYGCIACHQGVNVGGNLFQRFGVFGQRPETTPADLGRFTLTGEERDRRVFRVPSLRNVALTAPYFHDGSAPTLPDAVRTMARSQLGRTLSEEETGLIVQFLHSLTGERGGRTPADGPPALPVPQ